MSSIGVGAPPERVTAQTWPSWVATNRRPEPSLGASIARALPWTFATSWVDTWTFAPTNGPAMGLLDDGAVTGAEGAVLEPAVAIAVGENVGLDVVGVQAGRRQVNAAANATEVARLTDGVPR